MAFEPLKSPWWDQGDLEEVAQNTDVPFDVNELKDFLKITNNDQDNELMRAAIEATRLLQFEIGRAITSWTLKLHLENFPCVIVLPYPPLVASPAIATIRYVDTDGNTQTLSSSLYQIFATQDAIRIMPAYAQVWPSTRTQYSAVTVQYEAGYSSDDDVPPEVKLAIKWKVKLTREDQLTGTVARELRDGYDRLVNNLRRVA